MWQKGAERKATALNTRAWQARNKDTSRARGFFGEDNRGIVGAIDSLGILDSLGVLDVLGILYVEKEIDFMMSN